MSTITNEIKAMTKFELQKAFLHRLPVIYAPPYGEPATYQYIEEIEYTTDRFGKFKLGAVIRARGNSISYVLAEYLTIEDEKERLSANIRPCPFKMPDNFEKFKQAFIKRQPVIAKCNGKDKLYRYIKKLTIKLDYYGDIIFSVTVGDNADTKEFKPEEVVITSYLELIGDKNAS